MARLLSGAFDRVVTVDPHLHRTNDLNDVFSVPVTQLSAAHLLGSVIARDLAGQKVVLVGPDVESRPWVKSAAYAAAADFLVGTKVRRTDRDVAIEIDGLDGVRGKATVIVDDMVSTGSTVCTTARQLLEPGADRIELCVTHLLASAEDTARMYAAGVSRIVSTDSVEHSTNAVLLAPLLADALRE